MPLSNKGSDGTRTVPIVVHACVDTELRPPTDIRTEPAFHTDRNAISMRLIWQDQCPLEVAHREWRARWCAAWRLRADRDVLPIRITPSLGGDTLQPFCAACTVRARLPVSGDIRSGVAAYGRPGGVLCSAG